MAIVDRHGLKVHNTNWQQIHKHSNLIFGFPRAHLEKLDAVQRAAKKIGGFEVETREFAKQARSSCDLFHAEAYGWQWQRSPQGHGS